MKVYEYIYSQNWVNVVGGGRLFYEDGRGWIFAPDKDELRFQIEMDPQQAALLMHYSQSSEVDGG
jgi:hypothetical protein